MSESSPKRLAATITCSSCREQARYFRKCELCDKEFCDIVDCEANLSDCCYCKVTHCDCREAFHCDICDDDSDDDEKICAECIKKCEVCDRKVCLNCYHSELEQCEKCFELVCEDGPSSTRDLCSTIIKKDIQIEKLNDTITEQEKTIKVLKARCSEFENKLKSSV